MAWKNRSSDDRRPRSREVIISKTFFVNPLQGISSQDTFLHCSPGPVLIGKVFLQLFYIEWEGEDEDKEEENERLSDDKINFFSSLHTHRSIQRKELLRASQLSTETCYFFPNVFLTKVHSRGKFVLRTYWFSLGWKRSKFWWKKSQHFPKIWSKRATSVFIRHTNFISHTIESDAFIIWVRISQSCSMLIAPFSSSTAA